MHGNLFLVEHLLLRPDELPQLLLVHADIMAFFMQVTTEEDRPLQNGIFTTELLLDQSVNQLLAPFSFLWKHQTVDEDTQRLMHNQTNKVFLGHALHLLHRLVDRRLPSRQLARRIQIVRLLVSGEVLSVFAPEIDHDVCHGVGAALRQMGLQFQHAAVERPIDLLQRIRARVIHPNNWSVPQEAVGHGVAPCVRRWVAGPEELHSLHGDPLPGLGVVKPAHLSDLPDEHDDLLSAVIVFVGQVALVTKNDHPLVMRLRPHHHPAWGFGDLAISLECL
mmetsp:Transcript_98082/g.299852  ORF Transcript_98082/g.299852 Transcript_98082/m.299852 type:complete len:278 (+) Transcript_98082:5315-6148(+)